MGVRCMDNMDTVQRIGARIRTARLKQGLSQPQLAERANLSSQSVSNFENGKAKMSIESFVSILKALHISADELLELELPEKDKRIAELEELLFDCTPKEAEAILKMGKQLKETLRENK